MKTIAMLTLLVCAAVSQASAARSQGKSSADDVRARIEAWPDASRRAAEGALDKHGAPDFVGRTTLLWQGAAPFTRIVVRRTPIKHSFPVKHEDVIEHEVGLRVPPEKAGDLAQFDGSLIVDRTKGTVTARSDSEPHNVALLNLAREIVDGKRDVASARQEYAAVVAKGLSGKSSEAGQRLGFKSAAGAGDPDSTADSEAVPGGIPAPSNQNTSGSNQKGNGPTAPDR